MRTRIIAEITHLRAQPLVERASNYREDEFLMKNLTTTNQVAAGLKKCCQSYVYSKNLNRYIIASLGYGLNPWLSGS